jgi:hypothetical protein
MVHKKADTSSVLLTIILGTYLFGCLSVCAQSTSSSLEGMQMDGIGIGFSGECSLGPHFSLSILEQPTYANCTSSVGVQLHAIVQLPKVIRQQV